MCQKHQVLRSIGHWLAFYHLLKTFGDKKPTTTRVSCYLSILNRETQILFSIKYCTFVILLCKNTFYIFIVFKSFNILRCYPFLCFIFVSYIQNRNGNIFDYFYKINVLYLNFTSGFIFLSDEHKIKFPWINIESEWELNKVRRKQWMKKWIQGNKLNHWEIWMKSCVGIHLSPSPITIQTAIKDPASSCPETLGGAGTGAGPPWCPPPWSGVMVITSRRSCVTTWWVDTSRISSLKAVRGRLRTLDITSDTGPTSTTLSTSPTTLSRCLPWAGSLRQGASLLSSQFREN